MSREALHFSDPSSSTSHSPQSIHDAQGDSNTAYNEEDHRRLLFGLMRSGLTPQVELALRLLDEVASSSTTDSEMDDGDEDDLDSEVDENEQIQSQEEQERELFEQGLEDQNNSPTLTSKPLYKSYKLAHSAIPQLNDDERPAAHNHHQGQRGVTTNRGDTVGGSGGEGEYEQYAQEQGYGHVRRWIADVHREGDIIV